MEKLYVGITDKSWFENLSGKGATTVNFWRTSPGNFRALQAGDPFLFKLHAPENYIVGGGIFKEFQAMTVREAWDEYKANNGVYSAEELARKVGYLGLKA